MWKTPVRFIDALVDGLDLEAAGFQRARSNDKDRPGYGPADLLKLYIYGYLNRIRSSRWLEVETHRNLKAIWLLRQLRPDFKTIADFRRGHRNAFWERKEPLEGHRQALDDSGEAQRSLTDPDSRSMHPGTRGGVGYNVQIAVNTKHNLMQGFGPGSSRRAAGPHVQTATAARENLAVGEIDVVADRGYYQIEDIEDCEAAGIVPYVPKPDRSMARHSSHYMKSEFKYDVYGCPSGQRLVPLYRHCVSKTQEGTWVISYANRAACRSCGLRDRCTKNTYRRIVRYGNEATMDQMAERLAARPEVMDRRRESVEHPFGSIKRWMGHGTFLTCRLDKVRREFSLTALAYTCDARSISWEFPR